jgi:hypothetical protein
VQHLLEIWCHGCAEGSSVLGRIRRGVRGTTFPCWRGIRRPSRNNRQARMNPAGRDASVAPNTIAAFLCSVVTDRSRLFAGMTKKTAVAVGFPDSPSRMANWILFLATGVSVKKMPHRSVLAAAYFYGNDSSRPSGMDSSERARTSRGRLVPSDGPISLSASIASIMRAARL